jgi:light-regulated signal transduction histidine kinase (bacteriophytochrome)
VHGLLIGPGAGSCGPAAHRRAPVVVEDIATDPLWADFRQLALPLGLRACWSTPILSSKGEVLGTWAVYRPSPGAPTAADEEVVRVATRLAAIAIERARADLALRQRAEELARLTEALQRSNRELDQFAYVTSHDLKAPLRGIANLSQWIEDDEHEHLSEVSKRNLELLRNRVQRMDALIDAILEYSRVGRTRVPTEVVAVGPLIEEVVDLLSPPGGFRVEVAGLLPSVVAERTLLQQVFMNLIGNAIKHHRDRASGRAVVSCADVGSHWRFTVADNGPGISPRFHDKVFVIFQTLEARDRSEGTGVGLALVKKIVEGSGGAVVLDSDVGRGAAFSFTWPKGLG